MLEARFPQKDVISIQKIVHCIKKARTIGVVRHWAVLAASGLGSGPTTAGTVNDESTDEENANHRSAKCPNAHAELSAKFQALLVATKAFKPNI